ncbi:MAG: hypothetical protein KGM17_12665 [Sphingomonadales bacterium]|nr:hypothetical protein [Sphingomonadales bacterium]
MNRVALGAFAAMLLASAGLFWWQGRAEVERGVPPPDVSGTAAPGFDVVLPSADPHGRGPGLPTARRGAASKEERRFARLDRNRNGRVERAELLATRVKAFQKLDANHDNLLTFEEWAVKTVDRFRSLDRDGDGVVSRAELDAWYAARDAKAAARARPSASRPGCSCAPAKPSGKGTRAASDDEGEPPDES